jgi:hypothetical protein
LIQSLLNISTAGRLKEKLEDLGIENLIHPHVVFIFEDKKFNPVRYERNKRIDISDEIKKHPETKWLLPYIKVNKTLGELIYNHQSYYGGTFDKIIRYDPATQNTYGQNFIEDFLESNNLSSESIQKFYRQDTQNIMTEFVSTNQLVEKIVLMGMTLSNVFGDGI